MYKCSISLENFRNFRDFYVDFPCEKIIVVQGGNGTGKTSILEAIFYLFHGTSFRVRDVYTLINKNSNYFKISFNLGSLELFTFLDAFGNKKVSLNGENANRSILKKYFIPVYSIGRENLIDGSFSDKRKVVDKLASLSINGFRNALYKYERVSKNKKESILLGDLLTLRAINEKLFELYSIIHKGRRKVLNRLSCLAQKLGFYNIEFNIEPSIYDFYDLDNALDLEVKEGKALKGANFDTIFVKLEGLDARTYLSHGEKQFLWLVLFFRFIQEFSEESGQGILMLMDEVFSVLDDEKTNRLIESIQNDKGNVMYFFTSQREIGKKHFHIYLEKEYGRV